MKPFQTLLFLVVIVLIGGVAALYWGKSVQDVTAPIEVVEEPASEPVEDELAAGSYLVFQSATTSDAGTQDWANDDTETYTFYRMALGEGTYRVNPSVDDLVEIVSVEHGPDFFGSLTTKILGQDLLMHRYESTRGFDDETGMPTEGEERDALFSLEGELLEVRPEQWGTIRSKNGRYEVAWTYDGEGADAISVTDLALGEVLLTLDGDVIKPSSERWEVEPFQVDDRGEYFFAREVCGCEARLSGLWQIEIATGDVTQLDTLVDLDSWSLSSLNANNRGLLAIHTNTEPRTDAPGENLLPPTTIRILDLDTFEVGELLVDEERAWAGPWLDPEGNDRYIVGHWSDAGGRYLVDFDDREILDEHGLTAGSVLDWVGDWLVVEGDKDSGLKLVNVETKEEVLLGTAVEQLQKQLRYIGSIELE